MRKPVAFRARRIVWERMMAEEGGIDEAPARECGSTATPTTTEDHMFEHYDRSDRSFAKKPLAVLLAILIAIGAGTYFTWRHMHHPHPGTSAKQAAAGATSSKTPSAGVASSKTPAAANHPAAEVKTQGCWLLIHPHDTFWGFYKMFFGKAPTQHQVEGFMDQLRAVNPGLPRDPRDLMAWWYIWIPASLAPEVQKTQASLAEPRAHSSRPVLRAKAELAPKLVRTAIALTTTSEELTDELEDPPLAAFPLPAYPLELTAPPPPAPVPSITPVTRTEPEAPRARKVHPPKGFAFPLPARMGLVPANQWLETRLIVTGDDGTTTQRKLPHNSRIKVQHGKYVLYVPIQGIPSQPYALWVGGIHDAIPGAEFTENAQPVWKHFPTQHRYWGPIEDVAQGGASSAFLLLAGAGAVTAGTVPAGILAFKYFAGKHQAKVQAQLEAAEDKVINAGLKLETARAANPTIGQAP